MKERKRNTKKKRKVDTLTHIVVVTSVAIMILIADVFFVSIQNKHFASGTDLTVYSDTSNVVTETILSNRGTIYDRDGVVIAEDNHTYDIYCILDSSRPSADGIAYVKDKEGTAKILSEILYIDYDKVLDMLNQNVYQTELGKAGRNLSKDVKDEIEITMEEIKILEIMKNKPDITIKQLTVILSGISNRTITRNIVILKKKGLLERVGSRKKGYWKVKR